METVSVPRGVKLLIEARALREAAEAIEGLHVSNTPGDVAEYVRDRADRIEAEAKGGV